ncbi:discoidin domain-containing protein [Eubacterium sp. BX4]|uniref:Discoidin domain-containing protein n=1 Tax=Eubacterium segne TaxID=2763045 RepID=A0ABR7F2B9_9FIRM|nr:discoidin domain-containing protein [Eubacterium segne]MBC5666970.1 discoidin domain-containing protein [Eubacterium segne]
MKKESIKKKFKAMISFVLALVLLVQPITMPKDVYASGNVKLEINGFQISAMLEAFRTIYSVSETDKTDEIGLVYGLTDSVSEDEMIVGSSNTTVHSYAATPLGETGKKYSSLDNAKSYCLTMEFIKNAEFYKQGISVRAYAKLKDGSYVYSNISTMSVYDVAGKLYNRNLMSNMRGHEYLYDSILSVVDSSYKKVDYMNRNTIVTAEAEENTTVAPTEKPTEPETTAKPEETTTKAEVDRTTYKKPGVQSEGADAEVASNISLNKYIDGIDTEFSSTKGNTSNNEGINNLFDGNVNTKFFTGDAPVISIAWKMKRATIIRNYTLVTAGDAATYPHRNPYKWKLLGSVNGTDWVQLDAVDNGGIGHENNKGYSYDTDAQKACQFFMLRIESSGDDGRLYYGSQLSEIYIKGDVVQKTENIGVDLDDHISGINTSATTVVGYNGNEGVENLFDGDTSTKLFTNTATPCSIAWTMKESTSLYSYTLTTANDNATYKNRSMKSWVLYGSNDGNNWDVIDRVNDSGIMDVNYADYTYIVDNVGSYKHFKLTVTEGYGNSFQLSEISLKGCALLLENEFEAIFTGDWDKVTATNYKKNLKDLFYQVYPRQYTRWGTGSEPKRMFIVADKGYDGVAYTMGNSIVISVDWMNSNPVGIGYFSHELTHAVQQYGNVTSSGPAWWVENMANYGGFRYYHWATEDNVQVYQASDTSLQDWGYQAYGNNKWFFAYMDAKYPTTKSSDGTVKLGLIDSINNMLKTNKGTKYDDNPKDTSTPWSKLVYQITGYDCIESLRLKYVEELKNGTWAFTGFRYYQDNWITEGIAGVDKPTYPMIGSKTHGSKKAAKLDTAVTSGTNLCSGASILHTSGQTNVNEAAEKLIDGNLDTKWCSRSSSESTFNGVMHSVKIDLGSKKTFNTYTIYNTQSKENFANASEWEILVSEDGKTWTSVDYQNNNNNSVSSYNIGTQTARYVQIKIFNPGDSAGTIRLYEFQLYNK